MLGDIVAADATAAWNIAYVVLDGCGLTHAGADLQRFENHDDGAGPLYASKIGTVFNKLLLKAGVASTQSPPPAQGKR